MSIIDVIERVRREPPFASPKDPFPDGRYVCKVLDPVAWDRSEVERKLGVEVPPDLVTLWNSCGGLILYEDNNVHQWGPQWGLVVRAPSDPEFFTLSDRYRKAWADSVLPGDFIFGRFLGDGELPLIRSDRNAADYGAITIVAEMDPRSEWHKAASSLEEFLVGFMDAHGEKYWEYHYQKKLAERAAEELLRSRRVN